MYRFMLHSEHYATPEYHLDGTMRVIIDWNCISLQQYLTSWLSALRYCMI